VYIFFRRVTVQLDEAAKCMILKVKKAPLRGAFLVKDDGSSEPGSHSMVGVLSWQLVHSTAEPSIPSGCGISVIMSWQSMQDHIS
jgi:hypothetical protein